MDSIDQKISIIMRQTDYSREVALEKLQVFDFNEINVIKDYVGIKEKPTNKLPLSTKKYINKFETV